MPIQNVCVDIVNELIHLEITLLHKKNNNLIVSQSIIYTFPCIKFTL